MRTIKTVAAVAAMGVACGLLNGCGGGGAQKQTARDVYVAQILPGPPGGAQRDSTVASGLSGTAAAGSIVASNEHAAIWQDVASTPIDVNPAGFNWSRATGISGGAVVGRAMTPNVNLGERALLWPSAGAAAIDLTPSGYFSAEPTGIHGNQQCGFGSPVIAAQPHALLWTGSAASAVDLHPAGFTRSVANGTDGAIQVGSVTLANGDVHAALWAGTAASFIDLTPTGGGEAFGVSNGHQVGSGYVGHSQHATIWSGPSGPVVDLHPSTGFLITSAVAMAGNHQVGYGTLTPPPFTGSGTPPPGALVDHALVWTGTAASAVDLNQFVPGASSSRAMGIDENGNIVGYAAVPTGTNPPSYHAAAVIWVPQIHGK